MTQNKQQFNYSALLGLMRENGFTQESLAAAAGMSHSQLNLKLNGRYPFKQADIKRIADTLGILPVDIGRYFFTPRAEKTHQI